MLAVHAKGLRDDLEAGVPRTVGLQGEAEVVGVYIQQRAQVGSLVRRLVEQRGESHAHVA